MSDFKIRNGILYASMDKGLPFRFSLEPKEGQTWNFNDWNTIESQFKYDTKLEGPAVFSLELGSGISRANGGIILHLTGAQTATVRKDFIYTDVKLRQNSEEPVRAVYVVIKVNETVTQI